MAQSTTGKRTRVVDLFPPLPADDPIFKRGFVIGMRKAAPAPPKPQPPEKPRSTGG
jgi:hypothetical protein